jgi:hypothetical protein
MYDNPRLIVEGSIHKAMLGHNVYGGPRDIQAALSWYISQLQDWYQTDIPCMQEWSVQRLDIAETFDMGSEDNVIAWINSRKLATYPRRNVQFYGSSGLLAVGSTTTLRAYAKGLEHYQHGGHKELRRQEPDKAGEVAEIAKRHLRCELQVNKEKLRDMFPDTAQCGTIDREGINSLYDTEWGKFVRESKFDSPVIRCSQDVYCALNDDCPDTALGMYQAWVMLAIHGEEWYRSKISKSVWYRQSATLKRLSISWFGTDILTSDTPIADFVPSMMDARRDKGVHPTVSEALLAYA